MSRSLIIDADHGFIQPSILELSYVFLKAKVMLFKKFLCVLFLWLVVSVTFAESNGQDLYNKHCSACHGLTGNGGAGVPLSNHDFQTQVSNEFLRNTIRYGRPGRVMPAFSKLSDTEVDVIVAFVRGLASTKPLKHDRAPVNGDIANGKKLFRNNCASCHGSEGQGGKGTGVTFSRPRDLPIIAPALNNSGYLKSATDQMIKITLIEGRDGTPMMSFLKKGLSEQDINDIVAYVRSYEMMMISHDINKFKEEPLSIIYESPYDLATTIEQVKRAANGKNFRLIRVQKLEQGLVEEGAESNEQVIIYFCNFKLLSAALTIDSRVGLFLPCRITVVEQDGKVIVTAINPKRMGYLFNNDELGILCQQMYEIYIEIIEEATL